MSTNSENNLVVAINETFTRYYDPDTCLSDHVAILYRIVNRFIDKNGKKKVYNDCHICWSILGNPLILRMVKRNKQEKIFGINNKLVYENIPIFNTLEQTETDYSFMQRLTRIGKMIIELYMNKKFSHMFLQKIPTSDKGLDQFKNLLEKNGLTLLHYKKRFYTHALQEMKTRQGIIVPTHLSKNYEALFHKTDIMINANVFHLAVKKFPDYSDEKKFNYLNIALLSMCAWYDTVNLTLVISYNGLCQLDEWVTTFIVKNKCFMIKNMLDRNNSTVMRILVAGDFGMVASKINDAFSNDSDKPNIYTTDPNDCIYPGKNGLNQFDKYNVDLMLEWIF